MQLIDPKYPKYILSNVTDPGELQKWKTAAETWRLPYWDFALRRPNNSAGGKNYCCLPDIALDDSEKSGNGIWYAYAYPDGQSGLEDSLDKNGKVRIPVGISFSLSQLLGSHGHPQERGFEVRY